MDERSGPAPQKSLDEILQAWGAADLNLLIDSNGVVLGHKQGYFLSSNFPTLMVGANIQDLLASPTSEKLLQALKEAQQAHEPRSVELQIHTAERELWFEAQLQPVSGTHTLLSAQDVTTCRESELKMRRQMQQLSVLRSIDLAIASGLDLNLLFTMLLDQVVDLMEVDAAAILLQNQRSNLLEFTAGQGFHTSTLRYTHLRLGEGCAGQVALERKLLYVPNLKENQMDFGRSPFFQAENFVAYFGVPLIARGRVLGVLELFHRFTKRPDADWLNFLNMIAGQAAIALDNSAMFRDLQRSNVELSLAYDATIEGLTRALDLRDKETEEHTRRVSELTVKLAVKLGVDETGLIHVRRGAILHDIGKMAIPDRILFKPGPLNEEEWQVMRQHPDIAVDLLASVSYLSPALDIPHWHHEKWDGSGYPDRLQGTEIPFSARMFALVDVYDALTSNRPYRTAWSSDDTLRYIERQSGRHFDPALVPEFVQLMGRPAL